MRSGLPEDAAGRLERVRAAVEVPAPTNGYESDGYAWSDAQEVYRTLAGWASRVSRGEDRSSADEVARHRLDQLLDMPGVAELLGPADHDARLLGNELFAALHVDRPLFKGESPGRARMRTNVTLLVVAPLSGLMIAVGSLVGWSQGEYLLSVMGLLFAGCFFAAAIFRVRHNHRPRASTSSPARTERRAT